MTAILTLLGKQSESEQVRSLLKHWLWSGMFGEVYTRGHEVRAGHDVLEVPLWLSGGSLPTTLSSANFSVGRLLSVRKRYGAVYQGLSALLRLEGAIDWSTGEEINDVLYFEQRQNFSIAIQRRMGRKIRKEVLVSLAIETMLKKVEAAGGWSAIASEEELRELLGL